MVDRGEAAGVLYVWQDEIERGVFDNPHYSFDDVEDDLGRRLAEDTKEFLKNQYIQEVDTHGEENHYQLTEKGREAANRVYQFVDGQMKILSMIYWISSSSVILPGTCPDVYLHLHSGQVH